MIEGDCSNAQRVNNCYKRKQKEKRRMIERKRREEKGTLKGGDILYKYSQPRLTGS